MNLGLTGGIACGKSTVSAMLVEYGAILIDADQIAREVVEPGSPLLSQIAERFGADVIAQGGWLDRKKLGQIVFSDSQALNDLEKILHPRIRSIMKERMQFFEHKYPHKLVVVDVPLLYESNLQGMFNEIMVVYVPAKIQMERLMRRDNLSPKEAEKRLQAQMPIEEKKRLADIVIDNSGTLEQTKEQVLAFIRRKRMQ